MEEFRKRMARSCNLKTSPCCNNSDFPYSRNIFSRCLTRFGIESQFWPLFDKNTGRKVVGLTIYYHSTIPFTGEYEDSEKYWNKIKRWEDELFAKAPLGLNNGWAIFSSKMYHFSLQTSLAKGTYSSMGISIAMAFLVMLLTTLNVFISLYAIVTIVGIIAMTVGCLVLAGWYLNILESIVMSVAVGLSIDFTMHYGVAYRLSPIKDRREVRVRYSFAHIGSAITMAAITTFLTGML